MSLLPPLVSEATALRCFTTRRRAESAAEVHGGKFVLFLKQNEAILCYFSNWGCSELCGTTGDGVVLCINHNGNVNLNHLICMLLSDVCDFHCV